MRYIQVDNLTNLVENIVNTNALPVESGYTFYLSDGTEECGRSWIRNSDGTFTEPAETPATSEKVNLARQQQLDDSDYIVIRHRDQVADGVTPTLTDAQYQSWLNYRQLLRDVPTQSGYPTNVTWPDRP